MPLDPEVERLKSIPIVDLLGRYNEACSHVTVAEARLHAIRVLKKKLGLLARDRLRERHAHEPVEVHGYLYRVHDDGKGIERRQAGLTPLPRPQPNPNGSQP